MAANNFKLGDISSEVLRELLGTRCNMSAGLAEGSDAATLKTTRAVSYMINGQIYNKAITDNIAMTACAQQAANTTCLYLVSIQADGDVVVTKGTDGVTDELPNVPDGECAIGAFKVVLAGGATFTSGTTDLSAANVTATYADLGIRPISGVPTFA
jgi:hypothetical protein